MSIKIIPNQRSKHSNYSNSSPMLTHKDGVANSKTVDPYFAYQNLKVKPSFFWPLMTIIGCAVSLLFAFFHFQPSLGRKLLSANLDEKKAVYFELRLIDENGHPVAGAKVSTSNINWGVTDSFGDWRRFIRVSPGALVTFEISKDENSKKLVLTKNFVVPIQSQSDIKFKETLVLKNESGSMPSQEKEESKEQTLSEKPLQSIWFSVDSSYNSDSEIAKKNEILSKNVIPALQFLAEKNGLHPDFASTWRVRIGHILSGVKNVGLIQVENSQFGSDSVVYFLTNYTGSKEETAENILSGVRMHSAQCYDVVKATAGFFVKQIDYGLPFWQLKTDEVLRTREGALFAISGHYRQGTQRLFRVGKGEEICPNETIENCKLYSLSAPIYAPYNDWTMHRVRISGLDNVEARVYASGFLASRESEQVWRYWGKPGAVTQISVVLRKEAILREQVRNSAELDGAVSNLHLRLPPIALKK